MPRWLWFVCLLASTLLALYWLLWRRRFGPVLCGGTVRIRGQVTDVLTVERETPPGGTDELIHLLRVRCGHANNHVLAAVGAPAPRPGSRVTIDGLAAELRVRGLYREPSLISVVEAFRVTPGAWPELRWLPFIVALLAVAASLLLFLDSWRPGLRHSTAVSHSCPSGTARASSPEQARGWIHWCRRADGTLHGPMAVYTEKGTLLERGSYRMGLKHGRWTAWHRTGETRQLVEYQEGRRHGPEVRYRANGSRELRRSWHEGMPHGRWTQWSASGEVIDEQSFFEGTPHGRFVQADRCAIRRIRSLETFAAEATASLLDVFHRSHGQERLRAPQRLAHLDRLGEESAGRCVDASRSRAGRRVEETFWLGHEIGPHREWDDQERLAENGFLWVGTRHGRWTTRRAGEPVRARTYIFGFEVADMDAARAADARLERLLRGMERQRASLMAGLAAWERQSGPVRSPRHGEFRCGGGCRGEGCSDRRGRQGAWWFPHEGGAVLRVVYLDGTPVLACQHETAPAGRQRGEQSDGLFERSCTWLELPADGGRPSYWRRLRCLPLAVREELGILSLDRAAGFVGKTPTVWAGQCLFMASLGKGRGGDLEADVDYGELEPRTAQRIAWREELARVYASVLRKHSSQARPPAAIPAETIKLQLELTNDGRVTEARAKGKPSTLIGLENLCSRALRRWRFAGAGKPRLANLTIRFSVRGDGPH